MATVEPPKMPPEYNHNPTPEQIASGRKKMKPVLIGFAVFLVAALGYWAYTVSGV